MEEVREIYRNYSELLNLELTTSGAFVFEQVGELPMFTQSQEESRF